MLSADEQAKTLEYELFVALRESVHAAARRVQATSAAPRNSTCSPPWPNSRRGTATAAPNWSTNRGCTLWTAGTRYWMCSNRKARSFRTIPWPMRRRV